MTKPSLVLYPYSLNVTRGLGMKFVLRQLVNSDRFDVEFHDEHIPTTKGHIGTIVYYEGAKIYLDFWEFPSPCHTTSVMEQHEWDLIIKLQHRWHTLSADTYVEWMRERTFQYQGSNDCLRQYWNNIVPWTFFPSVMWEKDVEKGLVPEEIPIEQDCFFYGRPWACRQGWIKWLAQNEIEHKTGFKHEMCDDATFRHKMMASRYGLVLNGKGNYLTDLKNRRTVEYLYLKKPLLLTHRPIYYNPLIPGVHYVPLTRTTRLQETLDRYDLDSITRNGYQYFIDNMTPKGIVDTFLQIMHERLGCDINGV